MGRLRPEGVEAPESLRSGGLFLISATAEKMVGGKDSHILGLTLGLFGAVGKGVSVRHAPLPMLWAGWGAARWASEGFTVDGLSDQTVPRSSGVFPPSKFDGRAKLLMMAVLAMMEC